MAFTETLIHHLLSLIALFLVLTSKVHSQGSQTSFNFSSFEPTSRDLIYQGDAFILTSSSIVRLTRMNNSNTPMPGSIGRVVYSRPVAFWQPWRQASFTTTVKFVITSVGSNPADGLTFFIAPVNSPIPEGSNGGSLGIFDGQTGLAPSVFAVEFDIFFIGDNQAWDPNYRHIGIDINSRVSRNVTRFDNPSGQMVTAHINYDSSTKTTTVLATYGSRNSSLSYVFDLKTILPQWVQVGISASTGGNVAIHDLTSWSFTSALVYDATNSEDIDDENKETHIKQYV